MEGNRQLNQEEYMEIIEKFKENNREDYESGKCKKIFLECLPRWGKGGKAKEGSINWIESVNKNYYIFFIYGVHEDYIRLIDYSYDKQLKITIEYYGENLSLNAGSINNCQIGKLFNIRNKEYLYNRGDIVKGKHSNLLILEQLIIKSNYSYKVKGYKYKCLSCGDIDEISQRDILRGVGCEICCPNSQKVVKEINSIWKTNLELVKYFVNEEDTWKYTIGSHKKVWFKCLDCYYRKEMTIDNFVRNGFSCNKCGDGISVPNKIKFNVLEQLNVQFEAEKKVEWCKFLYKNKRRQGYYDFYFEQDGKKYIIEMDGGLGHGKGNFKNNMTAKESQFIDDEKDRLAIEHGIEVIRVDCDHRMYYGFDYIKNNILSNVNINNLFLLANIDWSKVLKFVSSSRIKEACDLWNIGIHSTTEISKIMKMSRTTICTYLKIGFELKITDYTVEISKNINNNNTIERNKQKLSTKIICIENGIIFNSISECELNSFKIFGIKMFNSAITKVCQGKQQHHQGYQFRYLKDLTEEQIKEIQENAKLNQAI